MNAANLDSTIDCDEAVKFARELTLINRDLARNQAAPDMIVPGREVFFAKAAVLSKLASAHEMRK